MYLLIPKTDSQKDRENKISMFFQEELALCNTTQIGVPCPTEWWNFMCLSVSNHSLQSMQIDCPFYHTTAFAMCLQNGTWNVSSQSLFNDCYGNDFMYRAYVINIIYLIMCPLLLLLFITSVFKLHEFAEISREYHWKVIIWVLLFKSISLFIRLSMVLMNSGYFVYQLCMILLMICLYSDFFAISCMFTECLYIYAIIHYGETQLRIIKAALKHIAFISPIILLVVGLIIDVSFDDRRMFQCKEEPILSPISFLYVYLSIGTAASMGYMRLQIRNRAIATNFFDTSINAFRIEYDVLGRRKEVSNRDLVRMIFVTDVILKTAIINIAINSMTLFTRFAPVESMYSKIAMIVYPCNDIIFTYLATRAIWFNPTLRSLVKALKKWYQNIDRFTVINDQVSEELFSVTPIAGKEIESI